MHISAGSSYAPYSIYDNRLNGAYAVISSADATNATYTLTFRDMSTGSPLYLSNVMLSFVGLGSTANARGLVISGDYDSYVLSNVSELSAASDPVRAGKTRFTPPSSGSELYECYSTNEFGECPSASDNPTNPQPLSSALAVRTALLFSNVSSVVLDLEVEHLSGSTFGGRNFEITDKSFDLPACPCADTNNGATDVIGHDCAYYSDTDSMCASSEFYDDADFTASSMCCACGGGGADGPAPPPYPPGHAPSVQYLGAWSFSCPMAAGSASEKSHEDLPRNLLNRRRVAVPSSVPPVSILSVLLCFLGDLPTPQARQRKRQHSRASFLASRLSSRVYSPGDA